MTLKYFLYGARDMPSTLIGFLWRSPFCCFVCLSLYKVRLEIHVQLYMSGCGTPKLKRHLGDILPCVVTGKGVQKNYTQFAQQHNGYCTQQDVKDCQAKIM